MTESTLFCIFLCLAAVFLGAVSQVMLKKAAMKHYTSFWKEYLNPLVIGAYGIFFATTLMNVFAYRGIPVSMGSVLESTSYLYVTFFGVVLFQEHLNKKKVLALTLIIGGILLYALG